MRKFQYIGNCSLCKTSEMFTLEVEEQEFEMMKKGEMTNFTGTVIEAGKKSSCQVGYRSYKWCNPFFEMKTYGWPVFVKVD
jgi:hypothetical protein